MLHSRFLLLHLALRKRRIPWQGCGRYQITLIRYGTTDAAIATNHHAPQIEADCQSGPICRVSRLLGFWPGLDRTTSSLPSQKKTVHALPGASASCKSNWGMIRYRSLHSPAQRSSEGERKCVDA